MKMNDTVRPRKWCLENHGGYTEINSKRYVVFESISSMDFLGGHILFSYEYDSKGASTCLTQLHVLIILADIKEPILSIKPTYGGYENQEGVTIEENGYLLTFDGSIDPVALGALSHKIADLFRQGSVLAIHKGDVTFVYA